MSDRNTTIITDGGGGPNIFLGVLIGIVVVLAVLIFAFGWPISFSPRDSGPTVNIQVPTPPAPPAPHLQEPAPAPAPAPAPKPAP